MTRAYVLEWLLAFVLTQAVEVPLYAAFAIPGRHRLAKAFVPSALTHPVVWFVLAPAWPGGWGTMVAVSEVFAVGAEALVLRALGARRPLAWSVAANGASFAVGLLLYRLRGVG